MCFFKAGQTAVYAFFSSNCFSKSKKNENNAQFVSIMAAMEILKMNKVLLFQILPIHSLRRAIGCSEGTSDGVVDNTSDGISEGIPEGISEGTSDGTSEGVVVVGTLEGLLVGVEVGD